MLPNTWSFQYGRTPSTGVPFPCVRGILLSAKPPKTKQSAGTMVGKNGWNQHPEQVEGHAPMLLKDIRGFTASHHPCLENPKGARRKHGPVSIGAPLDRLFAGSLQAALP